MGRINIQIPDDIHKQMKFLAISNDVTLIELIRSAIEKEIKG